MMSNATEQYGHLTKGGEVTVNLTQDEACVVLSLFDYGIPALDREEMDALNRVLGKLKDQIWA
jgi:hypothetical protein